MSIPLWCLLGGLILPYIWAGVSVPFRTKQLGEIDIAQPRLQALSLTEGGAAAWGAQMNQWEAITVYTAALFAAFVQEVAFSGTMATLSIVWLGARTLHGIFYVVDQAALRILAFTVSLVMSVWIFLLGIFS